MLNPHAFVLDEQIAIWAETLCHVERSGGRFVVPAGAVQEERAAQLLLRIHTKRLTLGLSDELFQRYSTHRRLLQDSKIPLLGTSIFAHLKNARMRVGGLLEVSKPPDIKLEGIPRKDEYIVRLSSHLECNLVTEDRPLREALRHSNLAGKLNFRVMDLGEALAEVEAFHKLGLKVDSNPDWRIGRRRAGGRVG